MFKLRSFSGTYSRRRIPASRMPAIYLSGPFSNAYLVRTQITPDYSAINHHSAAIKGPIKSRFCKSDCSTIAQHISYIPPSLDTYRARTVSARLAGRPVLSRAM